VAVSADSLESAAQQTDKLVEILTALLGRDDRLSFERRTNELVRLREQKAREIEELNAATQALFANNRVASIDDELKSLTDRLSKLRQEWANTQADLDQSEGRTAASAEKLRVAVPATLNDGSPAPLPTGRASRISPDDYGKLTTKKLDSEVDSRGLRGRLAAIERSYNELIPRIRAVTDVKAQNDLLTARLASAKRDYGALADGIQELTIRQTTGEGELRVQAKPDGSLQPISPIKVYHVGAAAALAALIAIGLAYVLDYFEIRLFLPPAGGRSRRRRRRLPEGASETTMAPGVAD
jgi:predicted  nucleic acid-binding Zn-ribbon protein